MRTAVDWTPYFVARSCVLRANARRQVLVDGRVALLLTDSGFDRTSGISRRASTPTWSGVGQGVRGLMFRGTRAPQLTATSRS